MRRFSACLSLSRQQLASGILLDETPRSTPRSVRLSSDELETGAVARAEDGAVHGKLDCPEGVILSGGGYFVVAASSATAFLK